MLTPAEIQTVQDSLAGGPKTTAQLAIDCKWPLNEALKHLEELEREGLVARSIERASNAYSIQWEAASPDATVGSLPTRPAFESEAADGSSLKTATPDNPYRPPAVVDEAPPAPLSTRDVGGNFWLGFAAGFLGGMVFGFLFQRQMRPRTLRGLHWGVGISTSAALILRLLRALI